MRVLIFCSANLSIGSGSEVRARLIAEGLHHHGAEVYVVSSGVPVSFAEIGIKSSLLKENKSWETTLSETAASFKPDIIYGITEAGTDAVKNVAKRNNIPFAYDLHGIGVIEVIELGSGYGSRLIRMIYSLKWLSNVPAANAVTIANPTLLPIIQKLNRNTVPIFGMTDVALFSPEGPKAILGNDRSKIQILYAGNYFKWQGVNKLVDAIKILIKDNAPFEFTFLGSVGRNAKLIDKWKKALPEDKVHFLESVDYCTVADYYRAADVLVIPRPFMLSTYLAFPQKLVDYMASGKAIVATDIAPHRWAFESSRSGVLCPPTPQGIADGIRKNVNKKLREELSANARKTAVAQFCHIRQSEKIYFLFNKIMQGK